MKVEQINVFLSNEPGVLADISSLLAEKGINIQALSLQQVGDTGLLKLIVNDTDRARALFTENSFTITVDHVLVVATPDRPGGLAGVLAAVKNANLDILHLYAFSRRSGESGLIILDFSDLDEAIKKLTRAGIRILSTEEICAF